MTKLQQNPTTSTAFGGLFSIFKTFDKSGVRNVIDRTLGSRGTLLAFSHGDIFASLLGKPLVGQAFFSQNDFQPVQILVIHTNTFSSRNY